MRAEERVANKDVLCLTFAAENLLATGLFSRPNVFMIIFRCISPSKKFFFLPLPLPANMHRVEERKNGGDEWTPVWKSVLKESTINPIWSPVRIPLTTLCNADRHCTLKIALYDFDHKGKHKLLGEVRTNVVTLELNTGAKMDIIDQTKRSNNGYINSGTLRAENVYIESNPTFTDVQDIFSCFLLI